MQENHLSDFPEDEHFPPLPPPLSPGEGGQADGDLLGDGNDGDVSKLVEVPAPKRKGVKRPQPKLDPQRLISERGLPALRTLFDDVKFKGKGHEAENLKLLMQKMENWAHRLFPKLQFEDFMDRVEKLGSKKEVQTCLKRIRLDMPLTHEDFTEKEEEQPAPLEVEPLEELDPFSRVIHSTPAPLSSAPLSSPSLSSPPSSLTEEQRRRMELNRQRALERKLSRQQQTDSQNATPSSQSESSAAPSAVLNISTDHNGTEEEKVEGLEAEHRQNPSKELQPPAEEGNDLDMELRESPLKDPRPPEEEMESGSEPPLEEMTEPEIQLPAEVEKESDLEHPAGETESVTEPPAEEKMESEIQTLTEMEKDSELKPSAEEKESVIEPSAEELMESETEAPPPSSCEAGN